MEKLRPAWAVKAIVVIVITSVLLRCVCGANHTVGGATGWDFSSNIPAWSSSTTFNVGDDLVFSYTPVHDVVEVNQLGYDTCTIANAIATYNSGETVIHLTTPGTRYFVCGRLGHCQQGLKLQVEIQAQSNNNGAPPSSLRPDDMVLPPQFSPDTPASDAPDCDCSRAVHVFGYGLFPWLITLVITIVTVSITPVTLLVPVNHHRHHHHPLVFV